jgi:hypothetical protein
LTARESFAVLKPSFRAVCEFHQEGVGAAVGAVAPAINPQQPQAIPQQDTFSSLPAAHSVKEAWLATKANAALPDDVQAKADALADDTAAHFAQYRVTPYAVIDDSDAGFKSAMAAFRATHSDGVPTLMAVQQSGGKLVLYDVDAMAKGGGSGVASFLNDYSEISGHGPVTSETLEQMPSAQIAQNIRDANAFFHPPIDPKTLPTQLASYKAIQTAQEQGGQKFPALDRTVAYLQSALDSVNRNTAQEQQTAENIKTRGQMAVEAARAISVRIAGVGV